MPAERLDRNIHVLGAEFVPRSAEHAGEAAQAKIRECSFVGPGHHDDAAPVLRRYVYNRRIIVDETIVADNMANAWDVACAPTDASLDHLAKHVGRKYGVVLVVDILNRAEETGAELR